MKGLGDPDSALYGLGSDVNRTLSVLNRDINYTQLKKEFFLEEALKNVARMSPENYSRLTTFYKDVVPSDTKMAILHQQEVGCRKVLGDLPLEFDAYLDISDSSIVSSWLLNATYFNFDLSLKLEITQVIDGTDAKESSISAINSVQFKPSDNLLTKVAEYLKDNPTYLQMVPSLLLTYRELKKSRDDAILLVTQRFIKLNTSINYDKVVLEIPLAGTVMMMYWDISFVEMEFNVKNTIRVDIDEDILHLYSRHKSFEILTMRKLLANASDVEEFIYSFDL